MATPTLPKKSSSNPIRRSSKPLPFPLNLYQTAVGKKWVMAVTGIMLLGFVFGHMVGNLKMFIGVVEHHDKQVYDMDVYGEFLRELLVPIFPRTVFLWLLRGGLITAGLLHIHAMYSLTRMNLTSNIAYKEKRTWLAANFASRSMRYSGIIVLFYIIFHLADLTWGIVPGYEFERGETQWNLTESLSNPIVAGFYIIANILLSIHIFHGAYSMFQSLGINNPRYNSLRRSFATGVAGIICLGNVAFPVAVLTGVVEYDPDLVSEPVVASLTESE